MRGLRCLTASALFVGVLALVQAQQPGRGQFGGGFGGTGPLTLVVNKAVIEELKLSEDQVSKLKDWTKEEGTKLAAMRKEKMEGVDFKSDEGRAKFSEISAEITSMSYTDLEKSDLLKPEQFKRLRQIDRQSQGTRAFTSADVVKELKLTDDQVSKIRDINSEYQKDSQAIREEFGLGFGGFRPGGNKGGTPRPKTDPAKAEEGNKKLEKLRESTMYKMTEVLNADQKTMWTAMVGEPFDTSKLRPTFTIPKKDPEE